MGSCGRAFKLVVYRRCGRSVQCDMFGARHFAIAISLEAADPGWLLATYNRRGEKCESRIKEFGTDFASMWPPTSRFETNWVWMAFNSIAYNLLTLVRRLLFSGDQLPRLKRFSLEIYQVPCRLGKSGRGKLLRVFNDRYSDLARWERMLHEALAP